MHERALETTMVGSYPRPSWFTHQLHGRDVLDALKDRHHQEAFHDAIRTVIADQEDAGLDVLTDGQMWFDDYQMGIGSFLWYWFERIHGFDPAKLPHPARAKASGVDQPMLDEVGGVAVTDRLRAGPVRLRELYEMAQSFTTKPIKCCVGAGPAQLSTMAHIAGSPYASFRDLAHALAEIFNAEMKSLVAAGARHLQLEDLGAWVPNLTGDQDFAWVVDVIQRTIAGVRAHVSWHFCLGNTWGNVAHGMTKGGYRRVLSRYFEVDVREFVLDFACREMADVDVLADLPSDKRVAVGVIDVRSLEIESPEQVAARIRAVLAHVPPERVTVTTDCGMKQLPRYCARNKLRSLVEGARIVRAELGLAENAPHHRHGSK
jgi:5-methyltetrahydropteroyltriglutamate--homocysteine methyltransferase